GEQWKGTGRAWRSGDEAELAACAVAAPGQRVVFGDRADFARPHRLLVLADVMLEEVDFGDGGQLALPGAGDDPGGLRNRAGARVVGAFQGEFDDQFSAVEVIASGAPRVDDAGAFRIDEVHPPCQLVREPRSRSHLTDVGEPNSRGPSVPV